VIIKNKVFKNLKITFNISSDLKSYLLLKINIFYKLNNFTYMAKKDFKDFKTVIKLLLLRKCQYDIRA